MQHFIIRYLAILLLSILFTNCASKTAREKMAENQSNARPRAAAFGADGFYDDNNFPKEKYPRPSDFFYKHCDLSGRNPYPSATDWQCTDAPN